MADYPKPLSTRSGCKVAWYTYATKAEAEAAAEVAVSEAIRKAALGYDFGWCSPGEVRGTDEHGWVVTVP